MFWGHIHTLRAHILAAIDIRSCCSEQHVARPTNSKISSLWEKVSWSEVESWDSWKYCATKIWSYMVIGWLYKSFVEYHNSGFESVVKQLQVVLYKPDCNTIDCKLPSGQATQVVACSEPGCELLIDYHIDWAARWLVGVTHQGPLCWQVEVVTKAHLNLNG